MSERHGSQIPLAWNYDNRRAASELRYNSAKHGEIWLDRISRRFKKVEVDTRDLESLYTQYNLAERRFGEINVPRETIDLCGDGRYVTYSSGSRALTTSPLGSHGHFYENGEEQLKFGLPTTLGLREDTEVSVEKSNDDPSHVLLTYQNGSNSTASLTLDADFNYRYVNATILDLETGIAEVTSIDYNDSQEIPFPKGVVLETRDAKGSLLRSTAYRFTEVALNIPHSELDFSIDMSGVEIIENRVVSPPQRKDAPRRQAQKSIAELEKESLDFIRDGLEMNEMTDAFSAIVQQRGEDLIQPSPLLPSSSRDGQTSEKTRTIFAIKVFIALLCIVFFGFILVYVFSAQRRETPRQT